MAGDAGLPDAQVADGCVPSGEELCNEQDDDCNGIVDDGFDLARDPRNCGGCGVECALPSAFPSCELGECVIESCEIGFVDLNGTPGDGCEYDANRPAQRSATSATTTATGRPTRGST